MSLMVIGTERATGRPSAAARGVTRSRPCPTCASSAALMVTFRMVRLPGGIFRPVATQSALPVPAVHVQAGFLVVSVVCVGRAMRTPTSRAGVWPILPMRRPIVCEPPWRMSRPLPARMCMSSRAGARWRRRQRYGCIWQRWPP